MVKIVNFPGRRGSDTAGDFLQSGDDTLSFDGAGADIRLPDLDGTTRFGTAVHDWSNQELADLFRVKRLLDSAGVPNEVDRGLTDEGDPWFVFCRLDGDVFIHMCRIDGLYVLDSPNIHAPLRGGDFDQLIDDFTGRAMPSAASGTDDRRVIRLDRGGKVYLHPSVLLAALIWTLFVASDELVLLAPQEDDALDTGLDALSGLPAPAAADTEALTLVAGEDGDLLRPVLTAEDLLHQREQGNGGLIFGQNSFALGLSAVAIAMGVMSENVFSDLHDLSPSEMISLLFESDSEGQTSDDIDDPDNLAATVAGFSLVDALEQMADLLFPEEGGRARQMAEMTGEAETGKDLTAILDAQSFADSLKSAQLDDVVTDIPETGGQRTPHPEFDGDATDGSAKAGRKTAARSPEDKGGKPAEETDTVDVASGKDAAPAVMTLAEIRGLLNVELQELSFGKHTIKASFALTDDLAAQYGLADDDSAPDMPVIIDGRLEGDSDHSFTGDAMALFFHLMRDGDNIEVVSLDNGIILIDGDALNTASGAAMHMGWQTQDGSYISILGMRSDFQDFHLIA